MATQSSKLQSLSDGSSSHEIENVNFSRMEPHQHHEYKLPSGQSVFLKPHQAVNQHKTEQMDYHPVKSAVNGTEFESGKTIYVDLYATNTVLKEVCVEFDLTNNDSAAQQVLPVQMLFKRIDVYLNGTTLIQTLHKDGLFWNWLMTHSAEQVAKTATDVNIDAASFAAGSTIAAGATKTFFAPLTGLFVEQAGFPMVNGSYYLQFRLQFEDAANTIIDVGNDDGTLSLSNFQLVSYSDELFEDDVARIMDEMTQDGGVHHFRYIDMVEQPFGEISFAADTTYRLQLSAVNDHVSFAWLTFKPGSPTPSEQLFSNALPASVRLLDPSNRMVDRQPLLMHHNRRKIARAFPNVPFNDTNVILMSYTSTPEIVLATGAKYGDRYFKSNMRLEIDSGALAATYQVGMWLNVHRTFALRADGSGYVV